MSLEKFIAALQSLDLEPTAEELADVLWLTAQIYQVQMATPEPAQSQLKSAQVQSNITQIQSDTVQQSSEVTQDIKDSVSVYAKKNTSHDLPLRTPAARYLPHSLQLARALRPLMQRVASRTQQQLNEVATVERIAETQIWLPVIQGIPERRFELMLIVEDSPSMKVWQPVIAEFQKLLENQGAFRQVRMWKMEECAGAVKLPHSKKELIDPTQRRLILVVSDCISAGWYTGKIVELLTSWERHHPIALVQMLPQRMWRGTGLSQSLRVNFRATEANVLNSRLQDDAAEFWLEEDIPNGLKLPVITLESRSLGYWAKLMTGRGQDWVTGVIFESLQRVQENLPPPENLPVRQLSGEDRVNRFFATASPTAQQLARYLAAAPLTLEVMRLVQQTMLAESEQVHLAEVFLGGLLKQATSIFTEYDFHDGVRELLLQPMSESKKDEVFENVSEFLSQRFGHCVDFHAWLKHPDLARSAECRPFAQVAVKLFRQLGGKYQEFSTKIEKNLIADAKATKEEHVEKLLNNAEILKSNNDYKSALIIYSDLIRQFPQNETAKLSYLEILKTKDDYQVAIDDCAPNVIEAGLQREVEALHKRYLVAKQEAEMRGVADMLQRFEEAMKKTHVVITVNIRTLYRLLNGNFMKTVYHFRDISTVSEERKQVDHAVFGKYAKEIRYGVLSLEGGLSSYGEYALVLKDESIRNRVSFLEENSFSFFNTYQSSLPLGYRTTWELRHKLAVAKLAHVITNTTTESDFPEILLTNTNDTAKNRFIEAHIYGEVTIQDVERVIEIKSDDFSDDDKLNAAVIRELLGDRIANAP